MNENLLHEAFKIISQLKPYEWQQLKNYVDKKYSSKQAVVPMPDLEELKDYTSFDFPSVRNQQSECDIDVKLEIDSDALTRAVQKAIHDKGKELQ